MTNYTVLFNNKQIGSSLTGEQAIEVIKSYKPVDEREVIEGRWMPEYGSKYFRIKANGGHELCSYGNVGYFNECLKNGFAFCPIDRTDLRDILVAIHKGEWLPKKNQSYWEYDKSSRLRCKSPSPCYLLPKENCIFAPSEPQLDRLIARWEAENKKLVDRLTVLRGEYEPEKNEECYCIERKTGEIWVHTIYGNTETYPTLEPLYFAPTPELAQELSSVIKGEYQTTLEDIRDRVLFWLYDKTNGSYEWYHSSGYSMDSVGGFTGCTFFFTEAQRTNYISRNKPPLSDKDYIAGHKVLFDGGEYLVIDKAGN